MVPDSLIRRFYPDNTRNGTVIFYDWVRRFTAPDTRILNLGAGPPTRNPLRVFKGEIASVVGADIDPIVLYNDELDDAVVIRDGQLPLEDESFDLILSDYVLEHVEDPGIFMAEAFRVLARGGSFFFRTPNRRHYVATVARLTPHWFHRLVANRARKLPADAHEPWPTFYRLNTGAEVDRAARAAGFSTVDLVMCEAEPSYLVFATVPFLAGVAWERLVNRVDALAPLRANIFGRLQK